MGRLALHGESVWRQQSAMNIILSDEYDVAPDFILRLRRSAGLSQRKVAAGLCRSQGHVQRMERRQRSIEVVEFCRIARMAGMDPVEALGRLIREWEDLGCNYAVPSGTNPDASTEGAGVAAFNDEPQPLRRTGT
jgi:transcriptional regulator with XRE-family HTH domain